MEMSCHNMSNQNSFYDLCMIGKLGQLWPQLQKSNHSHFTVWSLQMPDCSEKRPIKSAWCGNSFHQFYHCYAHMQDLMNVSIGVSN